MKLANVNPKSMFKKIRSAASRSNPSSFSSRTTTSSSSYVIPSNNHKSGDGQGEIGTPNSVLPSGDWSDLSTDMSFEILQDFKLIDRDDESVLSKQELESLLSRLGAEPRSHEEVILMLKEVGCESDGSISLESLMSKVGFGCIPVCNDDLHETFEFFDADHDGNITAEELLAGFNAIGDYRCTLEDCRRMIAEVDNNKDGIVCFGDFSRMMGLHPL